MEKQVHPGKLILERTRVRKLAGLIPNYGGKPQVIQVKTDPGGILPCKYRGEATGEVVSCPSCKGNVSLKLVACSIFGSCTLAKPVAGTACCRGCQKREE